MRYSKGGRGTPRHTWGMRTYEEPKPVVVKPKLQIHGSVVLTMRTYWVETDDGERLAYDLICGNCHARYRPSLGTPERCFGCGLPVEKTVAE